LGVGTAIVLFGILFLPRWITVTGEFTAVPARALALVAPEDGIVANVAAREGAATAPGDPLVRLESPELEQLRARIARDADSLAADERLARAFGWPDEAERLMAERAVAVGRLRAIEARRTALTLRAFAVGAVLTSRPELQLGRLAAAGDTVLILGDTDSLDLKLLIHGGGATAVSTGQATSVIAHADPAHPFLTRVLNVAPAAGAADVLEARIRVPAGGVWRPGTTGEASVRLRRSTVAGALWWGVRKRLRTDLLL
jgi:multidrug resistance efflux pump